MFILQLDLPRHSYPSGFVSPSPPRYTKMLQYLGYTLSVTLAVSKINIVTGPYSSRPHNKKPFPKVNSVPSLIPLFFQGHVTIMWHFILNPEIQLHSKTLTREHQLYVRALQLYVRALHKSRCALTAHSNYSLAARLHDFRVPGHAMTLRLLTLSKSAKNRQQIARKKMRITVSLQHILNVIHVLPLEHDLLQVMLEPFKVLLFPNRNITWLAVLSSRTFPLTVHSLSSGKVAATPILKSVPSQFSPFIL